MRKHLLKKLNKKGKRTAVFMALLAALLYAISTPFSKALLVHIDSTVLASLLYFGAGIGISILWVFTPEKKEKRKNNLVKSDFPYTLWMILLDIAAPICLMVGLSTATAANVSLLNNFEIVATSVIAFLIFKEPVSKRLWTAIALITFASMVLSFQDASSIKLSYGSIFVLIACVCWGIENNCTREISGKNIYEIVILKGLFSGLGSLLIAFIMKKSFPEMRYVLYALLLGFVAYGLSIFIYIEAQKELGAAKTSAYYAVAPFIGSFLSLVILHERVTFLFIIALFIMIAGTTLVSYDTLVIHHKHMHTHIITEMRDGKPYIYTITHSHYHDHLGKEAEHHHHHIGMRQL